MTGERVLSYSAHQCVQGPVFHPHHTVRQRLCQTNKDQRGICDPHLEERKSVGRGREGKKVGGRREEGGERCLLVEEMMPDRTCVQEGKKNEKKRTKNKIK